MPYLDYSKACFYYVQGEHELAQPHIDRALEAGLPPYQKSHLLALKSIGLSESGQFKEALTEANKAENLAEIERLEDTSTLNYAFSLSLYGLKKYREAAKYSPSRGSSSTYRVILSGRSNKVQGDARAALEEWSDALGSYLCAFRRLYNIKECFEETLSILESIEHIFSNNYPSASPFGNRTVPSNLETDASPIGQRVRELVSKFPEKVKFEK